MFAFYFNRLGCTWRAGDLASEEGGPIMSENGDTSQVARLGRWFSLFERRMPR
jgi:hypothetical protein